MPEVSELALLITAKDAASKVLDDVKEKTSGLGKALGNVAQIAGGFVLGAGIQQLGGFLTDAAKGAAEDAASRDRLNKAIENTGMSAQNAAPWIDGLISKGQKLGFTDDQTRDSLSLLTAQTGDAVEASRRYALAQDLARGANIDVVTASKLLGKVTEDNVNVLSRYGIAAKEGMTETELFGLVQEKFGGQAATFADTTAGKMAILSDKFGELKETIGAAVIPVMTALVNVVLAVAPAVEGLVGLIGPALAGPLAKVGEFFGKARGAISGFIAALRGGSASVGSFGKSTATISGPIAALAAKVQSVVPIIKGALASLIVYFNSDIRPALENLAVAARVAVDVLLAAFKALMPVVKPLLDQFINIVTMAIGIVTNTFAIVIDLIQGDWAGAWKNLQDLVKVALDFVIETVRNFTSLLEGILSLLWDGVVALAGLAWDGVKALVSSAVDEVIASVSHMADEVGRFIGGIPGTIADIASSAAEAAGDLAQGMFDAIVRVLSSLPGKMAELGRDAASRFLDSISVAGVSAGDVVGFVGSAGGLLKRASGGHASGLTWVGERGPELLNLPPGSYVHNNRESMAMAGGQPIVINVNVAGSIRSDRDIAQIIRDEILRGGFYNVIPRVA